MSTTVLSDQVCKCTSVQMAGCRLQMRVMYLPSANTGRILAITSTSASSHSVSNTRIKLRLLHSTLMKHNLCNKKIEGLPCFKIVRRHVLNEVVSLYSGVVAPLPLGNRLAKQMAMSQQPLNKIQIERSRMNEGRSDSSISSLNRM